MAIEITMPKFGLSMEEGTIGAWLVKEGDSVVKGQAIAEVASEKLTNDAVAPQDGVVLKLLLEEGDTRPCGEAIALLGAAGESVGTDVLNTEGTASDDVPDAAGANVIRPQAADMLSADAANAGAATVKITPRAEKIARAKGLAYVHIQGTGRHGMITIDDLKREGRPLGEVPAAPVPVSAPGVSATAPAPNVMPAAVSVSGTSSPVAPAAPAQGYAPVPVGGVVTALSPMQKAIAAGMFQSLAQTAQTTISTEANVRALAGVYGALKPKYTAAGIKLSYTAMIIKAVAMALEDHPAVRTRLVDEAHSTVLENIDIGIAVDVPGGLIVPVIRAANLKDLRSICLELAGLSARAQTGRLTEEEMGGACITVTNLGMFGITTFTPVLNSPEPCILGCGAIVKKPVLREGGIFADETMNLSLTHDHRIVNGAPAARFLQRVVAGLCDFAWV